MHRVERGADKIHTQNEFTNKDDGPLNERRGNRQIATRGAID